MILDELAAAARVRVAQHKERVPYAMLQRQAQALPADDSFPFEKALKAPGLSFICEVKKASPSKGLIAPNFPYLQIAREYEAAGAAAISVLTEPKWFLGNDRYLFEIAGAVHLPVLRKDFTVDPYMICEAKVLGASAVLLICAILSDNELRQYRILAESLGLSALVEAHTAEEVQRALNSGAKITGQRLRALVPPEVIFVSESGVKGPQDILAVRQMGADAVLVGEALMRAPDKTARLRELSGEN
jgi:indole-3-glycerol phosphate synthase